VGTMTRRRPQRISAEVRGGERLASSPRETVPF
jgi:hypothetical protein